MELDFTIDMLRMPIKNEHVINYSFDQNTLNDLSKDHEKLKIKRPKPSMTCLVCSDHALGYNFDAISCESCKAFFRRNALRPPGKLKCRGSGLCEVTVESRKRCKKCRLDKCFRIGMRKEWIMTDDEKRKKRSQIEQNRQKRKFDDSQKSTHDNIKHSKSETITSSHSSSKSDNNLLMTPLDWTRINQIEFAYTEATILNKVVGVPSFPATQRIHSTVDLIRIPAYLSSIRLITFLKNIPEFDLLEPDDRVTLVKYNLLAVVFMHIVLLYNSKDDTYHEFNTEDPIFQGKDWIEILGKEFYQSLTDLATKLINIVQNDRVIIKIFLLLILFTKGFCSYDIIHEPSLKNHSIVLQIQNHYLESLYKYSIHHYGLIKTENLLIHFLPHLLSVQHLAVNLKDYVHDHIDPSQISPLMQSVLQLQDSSSSSSSSS